MEVLDPVDRLWAMTSAVISIFLRLTAPFGSSVM